MLVFFNDLLREKKREKKSTIILQISDLKRYRAQKYYGW